MKYRLSRKADRDLEDIWAYIAADAPRRAERFLDLLYSKFRRLARHPLMGQACPELADQLRLFAVKNYVIFYRPLEDGIEVARVVHGAQNVEALFRSPE